MQSYSPTKATAGRRMARSALECGGAPPLLRKHSQIQNRCFSALTRSLLLHAQAVTALAARTRASTFRKWHLLRDSGHVLKAHYFCTPQRLEVLQRGLLTVTRDFCWELEAWAMFSNHYHFIAHSLSDLGSAKGLSQNVRRTSHSDCWMDQSTGQGCETKGLA